MADIPVLFAQKVAAAMAPAAPAAQAEAARRALLGSLGVDLSAPPDPTARVDAAAYYAFCERAARLDRDGVTLPLRVGASMRADDYGAFGLAWKSAVDLRRSFGRAERYGRVLTRVASYELISNGARRFMALRRDGPRRLGLRLSNEQTLAAIMTISREASAHPFAPVAAYFKHPAPTTVAAHEAFFGCPVYFAAEVDALEVSEAALSASNRLGDARISAFFDAHLDAALAELPDATSLARRVSAQISQALSDGVPTVEVVAARLGVSARTLQRRLSEEEASFQNLVDATRRALAERLVADGDYPLAEVAFLTGFSEQSAFNRAFKRWRGQTPAVYRRSAGTP